MSGAAGRASVKARPSAPVADRDARALRLQALTPYLLVLGAALMLRPLLGGVPDVSWQITIAEKVLDGARLYADILEVNPPASTFLYLPAVAFARLVRMSPEFVIDLQFLLLACLSLWTSASILRRTPFLDGLNVHALGVFTLVVLTLIPARTFAQREHFALIAMLPVLAALCARAGGSAPARWQAVVAGLGAGMSVCIKPHFVLVVLFAAGVAALRRRTVRPLFALENWIAAALVLLYGAVVFVFYRAFFTDMMPLLRDLYLPVRLPLWMMATKLPMLLWVAAVLAILGLDRNAWRHPVLQILFAGSLGFAVAFIAQGKGWPYHSLPMLGLTLIGLDFAAALRRRDNPEAARGRVRSIAAVLILMLVGAWSFVWLSLIVDTRAVTKEVRRLADTAAIAHPVILTVSGDLAVGHPLTRDVAGRWLARVCSLWISENAMLMRRAGRIAPQDEARIAAYEAQERARLRVEIAIGRPDFILVDKTDRMWTDWIAADPQIARALAAYAEIATVDRIAILQAKPPVAGP